MAPAGGCLSSQYLADQSYVAPVGEKDEYVDRGMAHVQRNLPANATA